jgi:hypothetical protein
MLHVQMVRSWAFMIWTSTNAIHGTVYAADSIPLS